MSRPADPAGSQDGAPVRFDWGPAGLAAIGPGAAAIVVVDVLSFSTAVAVATECGARVYPAVDHAEAIAIARRTGASVADRSRSGSPPRPSTLSPTTLRSIAAGTSLVLASPNGGTVSRSAAGLGPPVYCASLRNAGAVTDALRGVQGGGPVVVIACGERWPDGSLRPALEDRLGAGAVIDALVPDGSGCSPEARAAAEAFRGCDLGSDLAGCASGLELAARGWAGDVALAAETDSSAVVARLDGDGAFVGSPPPRP